ncbi:uncharacterized protein LOC143989955 [Lithobates pipiens]
MAEALAPLRLQGIAVIPYLDDLLFFAPSSEELQINLGKARSHLEALGWILNLQKSSLNPSQEIRFLGYLINSVDQKIFLPLNKKDRIYGAVSLLQTSQNLTVRQVMSALGVLTSTMPAFQWARLHFRCLQAFLLRSWDHTVASLEAEVRVPTQVKRSLWWWKRQDVLSEGLVWVFPVEKRLTTDASSWGWGAHLGTCFTQGSWAKEEALRSSNWRELKAIALALESFVQDLQSQHVQVLTDNATAVAYLNRQGGTRRSRSLQVLAMEILRWAERHLLSLSAVHLKGDLNRLADFLSRNPIREWSLNPEVFSMIAGKWGLPEVDLFASKENARVPQFFPLDSRDGSLGTDALAYPWEFRLCHAFPPFQLITLILRRIQKEKVPVILITPFWPKRACFSTILGLTIKPCWHLPLRHDLLFSGPSKSSRSGQLGSHSLVSEKQLLRSKGFSSRLISTLLASRKRVTRVIYSKVWKLYNKWCFSSAQVPGSLVSILEFLQDGADKGLAVSTLKVQVAALTVFLERSVASDPLVIRFFRAL